MNFPLNAFNDFGLEWTLVLSALIGIGFGFMLERAGFGSSKILAGIFYGRDWRVLKVMFSAIVTAMLGLYLVDGFGWLAIDQFEFKSTFLWSQIAGGLLLGIGFVMAGYCPGTSVVGAVSGKLDAIFVLLGLFVGILFFEEIYSSLAGFYESAYLGELSLAQAFDIPAGIIVFAVGMMALGAFWAVSRFAPQGDDEVRGRIGLRGMATIGGAALLVSAVQFAGPGRDRMMAAPDGLAVAPQVEVAELAGWILEMRPDFVVVDCRSEESPVPGAVSLPIEQLMDLRKRPVFGSRKSVVLVGNEEDPRVAEAAASLRASAVQAYVLEGGAPAWQRALIDKDHSAPSVRGLQLLLSGESVFGGSPPPPPVKKTGPVIQTKKKKKGGGC
jgi:rhodanese-related sulfurtransferase